MTVTYDGMPLTTTIPFDLGHPDPMPTNGTPDDGDDLIHNTCCCDPYAAICGTELSGELIDVEPDDLLCVVCDDLWPDDQPACPRCGCTECKPEETP